MKKTLSLVIPCYNEENTLETIVEEILKIMGYTMKDTTRVSYMGQLQGRNF